MEVHQFVIQTKENPVNSTRYETLAEGVVPTGETEITEDTKVMCFFQQRAIFDDSGSIVTPNKTVFMPLDSMSSEMQTAALELFALVTPYANTLQTVNLHQFVVVTKENPLNHTRENGVVTENTKVVCHLQERPTYNESGGVLTEGLMHTVFLEDLSLEIQTKAMELFGLVTPFTQTL